MGSESGLEDEEGYGREMVRVIRVMMCREMERSDMEGKVVKM